jgi:hypothetical protein
MQIKNIKSMKCGIKIGCKFSDENHKWIETWFDLKSSNALVDSINATFCYKFPQDITIIASSKIYSGDQINSFIGKSILSIYLDNKLK